VALVLGRLEFPPSADSADTALSHLDDRAAPDELSQPDLSKPELSQSELSPSDDAAPRGSLPSEQSLSHPDNSRPPDWSASEATRRRGRSKLGTGPATPGAPGRLPRRTGTVA
jgi:hypothetical protein